MNMSEYFTVEDGVNRQYRRFSAEGRRLTVRMTALPPTTSAAEQDPAQYFADSGRAI